jgi:hypothetical protein
MNSNPLAEHNAGIALSSKQIPVGGGGTGNMYQGQAGRAFVQGGGGMSQFHSFDGGNQDSAYARGSYAPVSVGYNSITRGGGSRRKRSSKSKRKGRKTGRRNKKCDCDIVTGFGGSRSRSRSRSRRCKCKARMSRFVDSHKRKQKSQRGGSNAAYSIAGSGTGVGPGTTALANPAPYTAYNSCHPVL